MSSKSNVTWSYIGTIVSMGSGFVLLPMLMFFLSDDQLGLWYVYVAIANLALLFDFGFSPTFARNIVYVANGAHKLLASGKDASSVKGEIDWHLLNIVIKSCKLIYAILAFIVLGVLATIGTAYISYITSSVDTYTVWSSWIIFCLSIFLNLYFLYSTTILRGYGDIASENKAKTFAKISQLVVSAILLLMGMGLVGAAIGYLVNSIVLRILAVIFTRKHSEFEFGRKLDRLKIKASDLIQVVKTIGHLAWRDGFVQLALYASTQAMSILCSLYLGLAETGTYSILLQLSTAICNFAAAYPNSFYPEMQAAYTTDNKARQRDIVSSSIVAYWLVMILGTIGTYVVILPLLPLIKPGFVVTNGLFIVMTIYLSLLQQHSICCSYIISMNEIPYMKSYIVAALGGLFFVYVFCEILGLGVWGVILGQVVSQVVYNNWHWPVYLCRKIGFTYFALWREGLSFWRSKFSKRQTIE